MAQGAGGADAQSAGSTEGFIRDGSVGLVEEEEEELQPPVCLAQPRSPEVTSIYCIHSSSWLFSGLVSAL